MIKSFETKNWNTVQYQISENEHLKAEINDGKVLWFEV